MSDAGNVTTPAPPDDPADATEPVEVEPNGWRRADPLATGIAVLVAASLLTCALLALVAAGNA